MIYRMDSTPRDASPEKSPTLRLRDKPLHLKPHLRQTGTAAAPGRIRNPKWKSRPVPAVKISGSPAWVRDGVDLADCRAMRAVAENRPYPRAGTTAAERFANHFSTQPARHVWPDPLGKFKSHVSSV